MAFFDPVRRCLTVRLVYDGLGTAGKTTNVRQAHALFTLARRGDVVAPAEERGRTLFFDWLDLDVGFFDEWPLRCQVLTVPGQFLYVQRRYELLRSADAVVLVCDSSPAGVERSRYGARFLRRMMQEGACPDVPVVVQANKQDIPGALSGAQLAAELGLEAGARVVEASAATGDGVRATLVFALQAARDGLRARLREGSVESLPNKQETPEQVYAHLLRHENDSQGAVLADEVIASFLSDDAPVSIEGLGLAAYVAAGDGDGRGPGILVGDDERRQSVSIAGDVERGPGASAGDERRGEGAGERPAVAGAGRGDDGVRGVAGGAGDDDMLPQPDPPLGLVWPPALGPSVVREAVARLAPGTRLPPPGPEGDEAGELELFAGTWALVTAPSLVFGSEAHARFGLDEMVRARAVAADLTHPSTVFVVRAHPRRERHRLWVVRPVLGPLFDEDEGPPAGRRAELTDQLAAAAARAVALAARHGVVMKVTPRHVGSNAGSAVYLGLMRGPEALDADFVAGMWRWADRLGDGPLAELYGGQLRRALRRHADASDLAIVGFARALEAFRPTSDAGARLVAALREP